ncbi:MAG: hypothetical protein WA821_10475 [Anaerolineales bacterium]
MDGKIRFIQLVLWVGIILDGINVILYLFPSVMLGSIGLPGGMLTPVATYLLFHAGVFMLAWTILLVWAFQKPVARRFILLLTVLITLGMEASAIYLLTVEGIAKAGVIPLLILPVIVGSLFAAGYFIAGRISSDESG